MHLEQRSEEIVRNLMNIATHVADEITAYGIPIHELWNTVSVTRLCMMIAASSEWARTSCPESAPLTREPDKMFSNEVLPAPDAPRMQVRRWGLMIPVTRFKISFV